MRGHVCYRPMAPDDYQPHLPAPRRPQDGVRRLLNLLRALLTSLRSANPPDLRMERQVETAR